jgi:hypothetical protein
MSKVEAYLSPYGMITAEDMRDLWTVTLDLMGRNVVGPRFIEGPTLAVALEGL